MRTRPPLEPAVGQSVITFRGLTRDPVISHAEITRVGRKYVTTSDQLDYEIETGAARAFAFAQNGCAIASKEQYDFDLARERLIRRLADLGVREPWPRKIADLDALEKVIRIIEQALR